MIVKPKGVWMARLYRCRRTGCLDRRRGAFMKCTRQHCSSRVAGRWSLGLELAVCLLSDVAVELLPVYAIFTRTSRHYRSRNGTEVAGRQTVDSHLHDIVRTCDEQVNVSRRSLRPTRSKSGKASPPHGRSRGRRTKQQRRASPPVISSQRRGSWSTNVLHPF